MNRDRKLHHFLLGCCLFSLATTANAQQTIEGGADQDGAEDHGGDIIVTATRQNESLSRVPLSVAAFDATQMDKQNVRQIDDLARMTPGLSFGRSPFVNGFGSSISIRGISSGIGAATTAIYIDDTPIQSRSLGNTATNTYPLIFDLERVEVLRGPQGTLFGASSQGGAVRFITPRPDLDDPSVYARTEVSAIEGGSMNYELGVAGGVPLIRDRLAIRISAWYRHDGGWVDRIPGLRRNQTAYEVVEKNINTQNAHSIKAALAWSPADWLTVTPSLYYQKQKVNDSAGFADRVRTNAASAGTWDFLPLSDTGKRQYVTPYSIPQTAKDRFYLPAFLVEADLGGVMLISNSSYFDRRLDSVGDYTYQVRESFSGLPPFLTLPNEASTSYFTNTQKIFSQEIRLQSNGDGPLRWAVGGFYSHAKQVQLQDIVAPDLDTILRNAYGVGVSAIYGSPILEGGTFFYTNIASVDEQLSAFAQLDYEVLPGLTLTAGGRISRTKFEANILRDGPLAGGRTPTSGHQSESPFTPKFGVNYQIDPTTMIYASVSKGFRPGGAQAQLSSVTCAADFARLGITESPTTFNSDSLWSYEAGVKSRIGNEFSVEASGYLIKWDDIQQNVYLSSCGGTYTANLGKVTSKGFDVSFRLRPSERFSVSGSIAYNDAYYSETVFATPIVIMKTKGSPIGVAPWVFNVSAEYELPINSSDDRVYARADLQHAAGTERGPSTDFGFDIRNDTAAPSTNVNLKLGTRFDSVDIAAFVNNLFDDAPISTYHSSRTSGLFLGQAPRPRTFGVTASYRY